MSTLSRALMGVVALIVTAAVVGAMVLRSPSPGDDAASGSSYRSRSLASLHTRAIPVARGPLCEGTPAQAVLEALGREPVKARSYGNGDLTKLTPQVRDIAHEYGCSWRTPRAQAHAWVFAPPVPRRQARRLGESAADREGCERIDGAPRFGRMSAAVVCRDEDGLRASYRGLFGDAWLTCELVTRGDLDRARLVKRTGRWCAGVLSQF